MIENEYYRRTCPKLRVLSDFHYIYERDENTGTRKLISASCSIQRGYVKGFHCDGRREDGSECLDIQVRD